MNRISCGGRAHKAGCMGQGRRHFQACLQHLLLGQVAQEIDLPQWTALQYCRYKFYIMQLVCSANFFMQMVLLFCRQL